MTAPLDPDELASALIDGQLPADEAARAAADLEVAARAEELVRVRDAVRDVPLANDFTRAAAISAAVEAGVASALDTGPGTDAGPTSIPRRDGMAGGRRARWLAAAAVVAILAVTVGLLARQDDGTDDLATREQGAAADAQDGPESAQEDAGDDADGYAGGGREEDEAVAGSQESGEGSDSLDPETAEPPLSENEDAGAADGAEADGQVEDLGAVADADELTDVVLDRHDRTTTNGDGAARMDESQATGYDPTGCPARTAAGDPTRGDSSFVATATVDGELVWVHLYPTADGGLRLVATNLGCEDVIDRIV